MSLTHEPLAKHTAARLGGPADELVVAESAEELKTLAQAAWAAQTPLVVLGGGSNVLVSDAGVRGLVILNKAKAVTFTEEAGACRVWAESGANFGLLARQCVARGWAGLEWAATVPGTVGGAVFGNAGAYGGEVAQNVQWVEVLTPNGQTRRWPVNELAYGYRTSALKEWKMRGGQFVILAAEFLLTVADPADLQARVDEFVAHRKRTQPPGASMGSMFKNPPGDHAGRLIEAAGLKGHRLGTAQISPVHANFFINSGDGNARDMLALIQLARAAVQAQFGVALELEVELIGDF